jgi:hypothetical protein
MVVNVGQAANNGGNTFTAKTQKTRKKKNANTFYRRDAEARRMWEYKYIHRKNAKKIQKRKK